MKFKLNTQPNRTGLLMAASFVLAACGGGNIEINSPTNEQVFQIADEVPFNVVFPDGIDPTEATFQLNGTDVTAEFIVDEEAGTASANILANGMLDEKSQLIVETSSTSKKRTFFVDRSAPEFVITEFSPPINLPYVTMTAKGYIKDLSPISDNAIFRPRVEFGAAFDSSSREYIELDENNHFEVTFETKPNPDGLLGESYPIRFIASDYTSLQSGIRYSNDYFAPAVRLPSFAQAKILNRAFDRAVNPQVNDALNALNIEALIKAENPVVDANPTFAGFGIDVEITVTDFSTDTIDVDIAPTTQNNHHVAADVYVDDLDIEFYTTLEVDMPWPIPDIPVGFLPSKLTNADVSGDLSVKLRVDGNQNLNPVLAVDQLDIDLAILGGDFDAIDFPSILDVVGEVVLGPLEGFIFEALDNYIANKIGDAIGDKLVEKVNEQLVLIPNDLDVTLRGKELTFNINEASVWSDTNGINVRISKGDVTTSDYQSGVRKELGYQLNQAGSFPTMSATTPDSGELYDVGISVDWDYLNKAAFNAHRAGIDIVTLDVAGSSIPGIGNLLSNYEARVTIKPGLAPYIDQAIPRADKALASVQSKELTVQLEVRNLNNSEAPYDLLTEIIANLRADVDLTVAGNNFQVHLDNEPQLEVISTNTDEALLVLDEDAIQHLLDYAVPLVMPRLVDIIGKVELPCIKNHAIDLVEIQSNSYGYFSLYANVEPQAGACGPQAVGGDLVFEPGDELVLIQSE